MEKKISSWVDISEIVQAYLPVSKKKARRFALLYLNPKKIGNRLYVERNELERILHDTARDSFPLNI